jgi:hypothetical protein
MIFSQPWALCSRQSILTSIGYIPIPVSGSCTGSGDTKAHDTTRLVLRGADLKSAEQWLTLGPTRSRSRPSCKPATSLMAAELIDGRRIATNRRFALLGGTTVALVIVAVWARCSTSSGRKPLGNRPSPSPDVLTSAAEMVRDRIPRADAEVGPREQSLQLARAATRRLEGIEFHPLEADLAMRRSLPLLPRLIHRLTNDFRTGPIRRHRLRGRQGDGRRKRRCFDDRDLGPGPVRA